MCLVTIEGRHAKAVCEMQGEYIGIRCAAAKERYLQARKQGQQRLVFYSDHCGVWEQWKV